MDNSINFPAAIFQLPFFSTDQPDYLNYGAIGSIAGHELTHAFDSSSSLFDATGVLNNWVNIIKKIYINNSEIFEKLII